eukprot:125649_1
MSSPREDLIEQLLVDDFPTVLVAEDTAKQEIIEKFPNNDKLPQRIRSIRAQYESKLSLVEAKLSGLVQTQLDESKLALKILGQCSQDMESVRQNFCQIDKFCSECQDLLPNYEEIKKISISRNNISLTSRLLTVFRSIPDRAEGLFQDMEDDARLKECYVHLRKLVLLREQACREGLAYDFSLSKLFKGHFSALQRVSLKLEERIWYVVRDAIILAEEDPSILVSLLLIIKMEDDARPSSRHIFGRDLSVVEFDSGETDEPEPSLSQVWISEEGGSSRRKEKESSQTMRDKCFLNLEQSIAERFGEEFDDYISENMKKDLLETNESAEGSISVGKTLEESQIQHSISGMLQAANQLIGDLVSVYEHMVPCFPVDYNIFEFYETRYQNWLYFRLQNRTSEEQSVHPSDILNIVEWIQEYKDKMLDFGVDLDEQSSKLCEYSRQLMVDYMKKIQKKITEWVDNILVRDRTTDPFADDPSIPTTHAPEDLFSTLNQPVSTAVERLEGQSFVQAIRMVSNMIKYYQENLIQYLRDKSQHKTEEHLCAYINNFENFSHHVETLKTRCLEKVDDNFAAELEEELDCRVTGFVDVATVCITLLAEKIRDLLINDVLLNFFKDQWFEPLSLDLINDLTATVGDCFADYKAWITDEFYQGRMVVRALELMVAAYIDAMIEKKAKLKVDVDASELLKRDKKHLEDFFLESIMSSDGMDLVPRKRIESELEILDQLGDLINESYGFMSLQFDRLEKSLKQPKRAVRVLEAILLLRSDPDKSENKRIINLFASRFETEDEDAKSTGEEAPKSSPRILSKQKLKNKFWGRKVID